MSGSFSLAKAKKQPKVPAAVKAEKKMVMRKPPLFLNISEEIADLKEALYKELHQLENALINLRNGSSDLAYLLSLSRVMLLYTQSMVSQLGSILHQKAL